MIGRISETQGGGWGPWAPGPERSFERSEIAQLGKLARYGDSVVRFMVRLVDGVELFVDTKAQPADDQRWLRQVARGWSVRRPRDGWAVEWRSVSS